ncbi:MAG: family N-acetyltransferase [Devosia sp.]|nr:family N-acetyltransferase [Devosia sp.]
MGRAAASGDRSAAGKSAVMNAHAAIGMAADERLEVVQSGERLAEIGPAWMALWRQADGLIFQSHAWISAWWTTLPDHRDRALRIGLVWNGERLVAVLPLAISRRKGLLMLEWAANAHSDYEDALAAPDCAPEMLQRLWGQMSALGGYDLVRLNRLLPGALANGLTGATAGVKLRANHREEMSYRVSGQWADGATWFNEQPKKTRQNYRRGRKALDEAGEVQFRLLPPDAPLGPVLDRLAALKSKWLSARAIESELFEDGAVPLSALVEALAQAGVLHVFVLESQGTVIAVSINFVQRGSMMAFVTTYDPDFERASPGMVLMMDYIQWSIDHGLHTVDFLCGAEAFKRRFSTEAVMLSTIAGTGSAKGAVAELADRTRHQVRVLQERWRGRSAAAPEAAD